MNRTYLQRIAIIALFVVPVAIFYWMRGKKPHILRLQVIGEKYYDEQQRDTIYHRIDSFSFKDQLGQTVTEQYLDSGVTIVNFFFATCKDVCPKMNGNVLNLYEKYLSNPSVHFLSHTVDPESDSIAALNAYARNLHAMPWKWKFVTGPKEQIYSMAMKSYLLPSGYDSNLPADSVKFFHSQQLLLVDNKHRIRGVYDALQSYEIKRLDDEIKVLLYEIVHSKDQQTKIP